MELNQHQILALKIMKSQYNELIGGCENSLMDYLSSDEEYQIAHRILYNDQNKLLETIYKWTVGEANHRGYAKHIRFAGEEWLKDKIKQKLIKDGYYKEV